MGAMAVGGEASRHVLVVSPHSASCKDYEETLFDLGDISRWPLKSQISAFGACYLALGAMATKGRGWGGGVGGGSMASPCAGDMEPACDDPFFPARKPPIKHYLLLTANSGLFFLTLPTLAAMAQ